MRERKEYTSVKLQNPLYERLKKERDDFQETIGGGTWSLNDTLNEIFKIWDSLKK